MATFTTFVCDRCRAEFPHREPGVVQDPHRRLYTFDLKMSLPIGEYSRKRHLCFSCKDIVRDGIARLLLEGRDL